MRWWNEESAAWVPYRPGSDAPPRPPGWQTSPEKPPPLTRPGWKTPYRIVPIVLAVVIIVAALVQALRSSTPSADEARQAQALLGKCLARGPADHGVATYRDKPVACTSPQAAVKVVKVVVSRRGPPPCPSGSTALALVAGVAHPHLECVVPVGR
jgi:hypothetical protein